MMEQETQISDLNEDVTRMILSNLPLRDQIRCRRVCTNWRDWTPLEKLTHLNLYDVTTIIKLTPVQAKKREDLTLRRLMFLGADDGRAEVFFDGDSMFSRRKVNKIALADVTRRCPNLRSIIIP